jgi:hypothetical protein
MSNVRQAKMKVMWIGFTELLNICPLNRHILAHAKVCNARIWGMSCRCWFTYQYVWVYRTYEVIESAVVGGDSLLLLLYSLVATVSRAVTRPCRRIVDRRRNLDEIRVFELEQQVPSAWCRGTHGWLVGRTSNAISDSIKPNAPYIFTCLFVPGRSLTPGPCPCHPQSYRGQSL